MRNLWYAVEHRIHFWRHHDLHASHCVCEGNGRMGKGRA